MHSNILAERRIQTKVAIRKDKMWMMQIVSYVTHLGSYKQSFLSTWATVFGPNQVPTGFLWVFSLSISLYFPKLGWGWKVFFVEKSPHSHPGMKVDCVLNLSTLSPMRAIWWMEYCADLISRNLDFTDRFFINILQLCFTCPSLPDIRHFVGLSPTSIRCLTCHVKRIIEGLFSGLRLVNL